jgi:hypothetical protein
VTRAEYFYDPNRFNFGAKVGSGFGGPLGGEVQRATLRDVGLFAAGQNVGVIPYQPGASHSVISHVMPEHMPAIRLKTKERLISLISHGQFARGATDSVLLAEIIKRQPVGPTDTGISWLTGIHGLAILDVIDRLGSSTGTNPFLNRAIHGLNKLEVTQAQIVFSDKRSVFTLNGTHLIAV